MGSRLDQTRDWMLLAKAARYNVQNLARLCDVTPRHLRRHFNSSGRDSPHAWLHVVRMRHAVELICDKSSVKEAALALGYKDPAHFTHDFAKRFGVPPAKYSLAQRSFRQSL